MSNKFDISFFTERKIRAISQKLPEGTFVRKCPDCDRPVDKDGDTIAPGHCDECPNYSTNEPECKTCGYFPCDQSC